MKAIAREEEYQWHLSIASQLSLGDDLSTLGCSLEAHRSVVTAITSFALSPDDYPAAVGRVIALGDDTDTLAAMTGALCGAWGGIQCVPAHLLEMLEDGEKGRSYIHDLASQLYSAYMATRPEI